MQRSTPNLFFREGTSLGDVVISISPIAGPLADLFSPLSPSAFVSEAGLGNTPWRPGLDWPIVELFPPGWETVYEDLNLADLVEEQEKPNKFSPNFEKKIETHQKTQDQEGQSGEWRSKALRLC